MRKELRILLLIAVMLASARIPVSADGYEEDRQQKRMAHNPYSIVKQESNNFDDSNHVTKYSPIQQIRDAQAEAILQNGGLTANDGAKIEADTKRILKEKYGIEAKPVSQVSGKCPVDHEALSEESRNKGRMESAAACTALFVLYVLFSNNPRRKFSFLFRCSKKAAIHIAAIAIGILAGYLAYTIESFVIRFLASIPIIGLLLYSPWESSWALTVIPPSTFPYIAAWFGFKIAKTAKPVSVVSALFFVFCIFIMVAGNALTWSWFIETLVGIASSLICFYEFDNENITKKSSRHRT